MLARKDVSCRSFRKVCALLIKIVLADVNYWQIPELRQVHHFVQNALTEPAFAEKTDGDLRGAQLLG